MHVMDPPLKPNYFYIHTYCDCKIRLQNVWGEIEHANATNIA